MNSFETRYRLIAARSAQRTLTILRCWLVVCIAVITAGTAFAQRPSVGAVAADFTLLTPTGTSIQLSKETSKGAVVLVVLRGYPGYQCPYCVKQVHDFIEHASEFAIKKATVLFVYPGPPADLDQHAKEALAKQANLPQNFLMVTDPDYTMTNRYGLRWDAPHETAYPSTFILDKNGVVTFSKISSGHGDRLAAMDALSHLE